MILLAVYALGTANVWKKRRLFLKKRRRMTAIDDARALWVLPVYNRGRDVKNGPLFFYIFLMILCNFLYVSQFCDLFHLLRAEIA